MVGVAGMVGVRVAVAVVGGECSQLQDAGDHLGPCGVSARAGCRFRHATG